MTHPPLSSDLTQLALDMISGTDVARGSEQANTLQRTATTWAVSDPLYDITVRLLALQIHDSSLISGDVFAAYAKRLLAAEQQVGGPYFDAADTDALITNAIIAQFFRQLGSPLPRVESFVALSKPSRSFIVTHPEKTWPLVWPEQLPGVPIHASELLQFASSTPHSIYTMLQTIPFAPTAHHADSPSVIALKVRNELRRLPLELRAIADTTWSSISRADRRHELSRLNASFAASLNTPPLDSSLADLLDTANFYVWMAYSLYDDIIDQDSAGRELPFANVAHRMAFDRYHQAARSRTCHQYIVRCFNAMDTANAWELSRCRFTVHDNLITISTLPAYRLGRVLFRRAGAHTLGPMVMLDSMSSITPSQYRAVSEGLTYYVIARQLSDDIHDFKEDVSRGQISFVVAYLLRKLHVTPGEYAVDDLIERMSIYFWKHGVHEINTLILKRLQQSRDNFIRSGLLQENARFYELTLAPLEHAVVSSDAIVHDQKAFLRSYTHTD